jgi:TonB family protein
MVVKGQRTEQPPETLAVVPAATGINQAATSSGFLSQVAAPSEAEGNGDVKGSSEPDRMPAYLALVRNLIQTNLVYPDEARKLRVHGSIHVRFDIDPEGTVSQGSIHFPDEQEPLSLRRGALQTLSAIGRFPPPPGGSITVEIPLRYK